MVGDNREDLIARLDERTVAQGGRLDRLEQRMEKELHAIARDLNEFKRKQEEFNASQLKAIITLTQRLNRVLWMGTGVVIVVIMLWNIIVFWDKLSVFFNGA